MNNAILLSLGNTHYIKINITVSGEPYRLKDGDVVYFTVRVCAGGKALIEKQLTAADINESGELILELEPLDTVNLKAGIDIDLRINALNEQLIKLRGGNYGGCILGENNLPPQHNGTVSNPVQDNVENITETEVKIRDYKKRYTSLKSEIIDKIMLIDIHIYSTLLFERYINCEEWEEISYKIKKSADYARKELHWAALNYFSLKFPEFSP